ncbi:hypothetical protein SAMN04489716_0726 [Actinoplanes derwentensis]|uniref:NACHT domain-containing protein n=2 Tax=Actinoplanes derwentensis TaxID=113562 RepID=A0A1H1RZN4_9ACTN|nr:hypothetical protein SAMN04489716_0726 [Actinoplanes derwentensis]
MLAWFLQNEGLERADKWSSVVFGSVSAGAVCVCVLTWLWRLGNTDPGSERESVLSRLAAAQREQWAAEQAARRVCEPWPLNVRWTANAQTQAVMASWASVRQSAGAGPVDVDSDYARIASVFDRDDIPKRLVMLGEPGSGKSMLAIQLTLQLLAVRRACEPVAVLLSAASWNPVQSLDDWIADQLIAQDRSLVRTTPGPNAEPRSLARDLVACGFVLPVLDGLDELDDHMQRAALIGLSSAAATGRDFVVTCRTKPYQAAVQTCGPIPAAVVVELQPVPATEAAEHLADGPGPTDRRWSAVLAHLRNESGTPLTQALSTPLMIWLTRMVYRNTGRAPEELLTADWAASREGIEQHLLDHLIPATYPGQVDSTRRWLSTLATHLREYRFHDLAWWRISDIRPAPAAHVISIVYVILAAMVTPILAVSVLGASGWGGYFSGYYAFAIGAGIGMTVSFARLLFTDRHYPRRLTSRGVLRSFAVVGAVLFSVPIVGGVSPLKAIICAISGGVVTALASSAEPAPSATTPPASLAMDRNAALASAATIGGAIAAMTTPALLVPEPMLWAASAGIVLAAGLAAVLVSAWGQFCVATLVLAALRKLPLRLSRSLADAQERGVLRRAGSVYQFRHALLRDRLAHPPPVESATDDRSVPV